MFLVMLMDKIGIICEYNPFHNGHIYHLEKIREMFPDSFITLVLSSSFTQRGEFSYLTKWDKTRIALEYKIDLVIELPFIFATQSADTVHPISDNYNISPKINLVWPDENCKYSALHLQP